MKNIIIILTTMLIIGGCGISNGADVPPASDMNSKKILMVIAPHNFRDPELFTPKRIFEKAGAEVKIASIQKTEALGVEGGKAKIDILVAEADPDDFEAVVFVGGPGMGKISSDDTLISLARDFYKADKITSAICVAPDILARAGLLRGKKATSWQGVKDDLQEAGAEYTGKNTEVDGLIITGNGPDAAEEFARTVLKNIE